MSKYWIKYYIFFLFIFCHDNSTLFFIKKILSSVQSHCLTEITLSTEHILPLLACVLFSGHCIEIPETSSVSFHLYEVTFHFFHVKNLKRDCELRAISFRMSPLDLKEQKLIFKAQRQ